MERQEEREKEAGFRKLTHTVEGMVNLESAGGASRLEIQRHVDCAAVLSPTTGNRQNFHVAF